MSGTPIAALLAAIYYAYDDGKDEEFNNNHKTNPEFNDEYKPLSKCEKIKDRMFFWGSETILVICCIALIYMMTPRGMAAIQNPKEKKLCRDEILKSAHSDAVNSANTVNLADYEITSGFKAKCDSLYYARKISHFIHIKGQDFLYFKPIMLYSPVTHRVTKYSRLTIDTERINKEPKFAKYVTGYKRSVEQLAVQRRISNQK